MHAIQKPLSLQLQFHLLQAIKGLGLEREPGTSEKAALYCLKTTSTVTAVLAAQVPYQRLPEPRALLTDGHSFKVSW